MTSSHDDAIRPEDFSDAAAAAIADAQSRDFSQAARVVADAGLTGVCAPEQDGGLGLGLAYAVPIAHEAGKLRFRHPLVEQILAAHALAGTPFCAQVVSGEKSVSIAWQGSLDSGRASHAAYTNHADWILVAHADGLALIERSSVTLHVNDMLDPDAPQFAIDLQDARMLTRLDADVYRTLRNNAYVLTAAFLNGAAQGAMEFTAAYLATRVQFGRPLSAKQAVRHTLARMKLLNEVSIAAVRRVLSTNEFAEPRCAHTAWTGAVHNATFIIERAIHLNGGMGFTWEVPLHWSLRDARKIDAAFKASTSLQTVGQAFIVAA